MTNTVGIHSTKINTHFTLSSGTYTNEQGLISNIHTFLTTTISGWQRIYTVSDTGTDRNFVYTCSGSRPQDHDPGYVGFRGFGNEFYINPYSFFNSSTGVGYNNLNDSSLTATGAVSTGTGRWWFIGNNDAFFLVTAPDTVPNTYYLMGAGFWKSYYNYDYDPKPWWGMSQGSATGTFESEGDRVRSFAPGSFGKSAFPFSSLSGIGGDYACEQLSLGNAVQSRTGQPYPLAPVFYLSTGVNYHLSEVRGEIPGLYKVSIPNSHFTGNVITISGMADMSGDYFVQKTASTDIWLLGKITRRV